MNNNELMISKENSSVLSNSNKNLIHQDINRYDMDKIDKGIEASEFKRIRKVKSQVNMWDYKTSFTKDYFFKKNIFSNIGTFYSNVVFNKAPNWKSNTMSIHGILKQEKLNQIHHIENFHNHTKKLNESQTIFNNHSRNLKTNKKKGKISPYLINNKQANRSCNEISNNIKFNLNNDNKSDNSTLNSNQIQNNFFQNNINNIDNSKKIFPDLSKNIINTTNKFLSKEIKENQTQDDFNFNNNFNNKDDSDFNSFENKSNDNNIMLTLLPQIQNSMNINYSKINNDIKFLSDPVEKLDLVSQKLRYSVNKKFGQKFSNRKDLVLLGEEILKLKIFQKIQTENLEQVLKQEKYNTDKKMCFYLKMQRRFEDKWVIYRQNINLYLHFLFDKQNEMGSLLELKIKQKIKLEYQIEKLIIQNVVKQKELENLVEIRNFLLQVKNKYLIQPSYFNILLNRDSRKVELGNLILRTFVKTKNSYVMKFLDSLSSLKANIPHNSPIKKPIYRHSLKNNNQKQTKKNQMNNQKNNLVYYINENLPEKDKMCEIPKKGENVFESVDEFLLILNNLKEKNLILLKENEKNKRIQAKFNHQKEKFYMYEINDEISQIDLDVIEKTKKLNRLKIKNNDLTQAYYNLVNHKINESNSYTEKIIRTKGKSSFIDMSFFKMVNYLALLKHYKYAGTLLLEKLIDIFKKFLASNYFEFNIEKCYEAVGYRKFNDIMDFNKNKINDGNKNLILDYALELLKIYGDFWMFIKTKQIMYKSEKQNLKFIKHQKEEIQTQRKIKNAKEIRKLLEGKRMNTINKLVEKWQKPNNYKKKVNYDDLIRIKNGRNKSSEDVNKKRKLNLEYEFNNLAFYD